MGSVRARFNILRAEKATREKRRITLRVVEEEAGVSFTTLQRLGSGASTRIDFVTIAALCKYFGCGVGDLLEYVPEVETTEAPST